MLATYQIYNRHFLGLHYGPLLEDAEDKCPCGEDKCTVDFMFMKENDEEFLKRHIATELARCK